MERDFTRFTKNIIDFIMEEQIKLGYRREVVRLYYPLSSLCNLLGETMSEDEMVVVLNHLPESVTSRLGHVRANSKKGRFCIEIPEDGVANIHEHVKVDPFLQELVALVQQHDCTKAQLIALFASYTKDYELQQMPTGSDFDYAIHFTKNAADDYYYCFHEEGCHIIYHRFTPEDYAELLA